MKKSGIVLLVITAVVVGLWSLSNYAEAQMPSEVVNEGGEKIEWISIEEAMERHKEEPRYWIIDIYTDWCGWCKRMDATTFHDPHVVSEINKNFYAIKFDAEAKRDITVGERTFKFVPEGRRGYHELAAQLMNGKMSYPSIAYMSDEGNLIQTIPGFKSAQDIHPILRYFGSGAYKTTDWQSFQTAYASPYSE